MEKKWKTKYAKSNTVTNTLKINSIYSGQSFDFYMCKKNIIELIE